MINWSIWAIQLARNNLACVAGRRFFFHAEKSSKNETSMQSMRANERAWWAENGEKWVGGEWEGGGGEYEEGVGEWEEEG